MKKVLCLLMAVVLMVCGLAACGSGGDADNTSDLAYIQNKGTLIVGVTVYEPMNYQTADGKWTGCDTEYAEADAEKLDVEAEIVIIEWDNKFDTLRHKEYACN